MPPRPLDEEEFKELVQPLIGLEISRPWKGYGTTIFLELGALTTKSYRRRDGSLHDSKRGEAGIAPYYDWRIESSTEILHGASGNLPGILKALELLRGKKIEAIGFTSGLPELQVKLSDGLCLRTLGMFAGDPAWAIRLPDGRWLAVDAGQVVVEKSYPSAAGSEAKAKRKEAPIATETLEERWGVPRIEPAPGNCDKCHFFVHLDSDFNLYDHGCCCCAEGPFEGQVVNIRSGCPQFRE